MLRFKLPLRSTRACYGAALPAAAAAVKGARPKGCRLCRMLLQGCPPIVHILVHVHRRVLVLLQVLLLLLLLLPGVAA